MKIFLFNAPPGAGKDTAAELCKGEHGGMLVKFAAPLKLGAAALCFGGDYKKFASFDSTQEAKKEPRPEFFGVSCRQFQIDISEKFMKPVYGVDVFGKILASSILKWTELGEDGPYWVSDSGFEPEAAVLAKEFGPENIVLIRLHRPGCDFTGDSRGYVYLDHLGVNSFDVQNDGTLEELDAKLLEITNNLLGVNR